MDIREKAKPSNDLLGARILNEGRKTRFTPRPYDVAMVKKVKPRKEVAWIVSRITGTPAQRVGRVYALDADTAISERSRNLRFPGTCGRGSSRGGRIERQP